MSNKTKRIIGGIAIVVLGLWFFSTTEMANDLAVEYYDGSAVDTYVRSVPLPVVSWPETVETSVEETGVNAGESAVPGAVPEVGA